MARKRTTKKPTFKEASLFWGKLGCISFGGPAGQISIMHSEVVERRKWVSEDDYMHGLNYCMLLPGPEAQQLATYIGWRLHGIKGALVAGGLFVLPSYFLFLLLGWLYMAHQSAGPVMAFFEGVKPAVVAIIFYAMFKIGKKVMKTHVHYGLATIALFGVGLLNISFLWVVALGMFAGWLQHTKSGAKNTWPKVSHTALRRAGKILLVGAALGAAAMAAVFALFSGTSAFAHMAVFFSKAALVTFGGAYAVLPYVFQQAVEHYQWLTLPQMMDGLALGETTPGPLVMVVAFISFVGGWNYAEAMQMVPLTGGVIGASIATFFTFLPSFIFILMGGPMIQHLGKIPVVTKMLSYITAAVVGTVAYLALFAAWHMFMPQQNLASLNMVNVLLAVAYGVLLVRFHISMPLLVLAAGAVGLAQYFIF